MPVDLVCIPDVELIQAGTWHASTGEVTWTLEDLAAAVEAQDDPALRTPIIKLGHVDPRFDGEPTVGRIENLRVEGESLRGDLVGVPAWLAEVMPSAYPSRSIEGYFGMKTATGRRHRFALTALALLGVTEPAIESLDDVKSLYDATHATQSDLVAAGGTAADSSVTVTFEEPHMPGRVTASVNMDAVRGAFYEQLPDEVYAWIREVWSDFLIVENDDGEIFQIPWSADDAGNVTFGDPVEVVVQYTPAPPDAEDAAEDPMSVLMARFRPSDGRAVAAASFTRSTGSLRGPRHTVSASGPQDRPTNGGTMPLTNEQLTALGLTEDATPEQIIETLAAAATYAAAERDELRGAGGRSETTAPSLPDGIVAIDEAQLNELRVAASQGATARAEQLRTERDQFLGTAVKAGKFPPARLDHFKALWDKDPDGTREFVDKTLAAGAVPVSELGTALGSETADDDEAVWKAAAPFFGATV